MANVKCSILQNTTSRLWEIFPHFLILKNPPFFPSYKAYWDAEEHVSKQHREETTTKPGDRHHLHGNGNPTLTISCFEAWVPQRHFAEKCSSSSGGCSTHVPIRGRSGIMAAVRKLAMNYNLLLSPCVEHHMEPEIMASTIDQIGKHFGLSPCLTSRIKHKL